MRNGKCSAALPVFSRRGERRGKADRLGQEIFPEFHGRHLPQPGLRPPVVVIVDVVPDLGDDVLADYAKRILDDKNSRAHIIEQVGDRKLFDAIKNLATIDVKEVSLDEFKEVAEKAQA